MRNQKKKIIIVGGGAAGFFTAANLNGNLYDISLLERSKNVLQKVKIAGGGRCNVTHACFNPKELVEFYPRGNKELLSVFTKFQPGDTMQWFEDRGVPLKVEADNRIFPITDASESVIEVLKNEAEANGTQIKTKAGVTAVKRKNEHWLVETKTNSYTADIVVFATGSSPKAYEILRNLEIKIVDLVPSLFTFNIQHQLLEGFQGNSFPNAVVKIPQLKTEDSGPLLITHWGLSGPAVLKLSAWCARELNAVNYQFEIKINFLGWSKEYALQVFKKYRQANSKQSVGQAKAFAVTHRFWNHLLTIHKIDTKKQLAHLTKFEMQKITHTLCDFSFTVNGKSTFKEEFVTAGGVDLKQIDFKTMQVKALPDFYIAGEVLNIDAVTGGFNFQACWSEAWLIAQDLNKKTV